jgi:hypothetical protein
VGSDLDDNRKAPLTKSADLSDLPGWASSGWSARFLHTLYHAINASESPLTEFTADSASGLTLVSRIVKQAYPAMNYKVTKKDIFFTMVSTIK